MKNFNNLDNLDNLLVVITGPSGGGKSTVINKLLEKNQKDYHRISTYTTREPRKGEKDGEQYNFITSDEYLELLNQNKLIACSKVEENFYGAPKIDMSKKEYKGKYLIIDIGAKGGKELKERYKNAIFIYIMPKTEQQLLGQMESRNKSRHQRSKNQLEIINDVYDWLVINDNLEDAVKDIELLMTIKKKTTQEGKKIKPEVEQYLKTRDLHSNENQKFIQQFYKEEKQPVTIGEER